MVDLNATVRLEGRIDSGNAAQAEEAILAQLAGKDSAAVTLDAEALEYISSAGLRVILRLKKSCPELQIINVCSDVYEILEMTGFTEMMTVKKAYRVVSVEGCEVIGEGQNGKVYRIDRDNVVKAYKNADALAEIQHEREVARLALILGVPTAISYDVVRIGDSYGSVFELLDCKSFAKILAEEPEKLDWCVKEYAGLLRKIHGITVPEGKLPPIRATAQAWAARICPTLPGGYGEKLSRLIDAIPERGTMIHGDYHTKNIVLAGNEVLLIDMDTLSVGHPIFELAQMYSCFVGFGEYDSTVISGFQGFSAELAAEFWRRTLRAYLGTDDEKTANEIENKLRCVSYTRLIDWNRRHKDPGTEADRATRELWTGELLGLLDTVDNLDFDLSEPAAQSGNDPNELEIEAATENLQEVLDFIERRLEGADCPPKTLMQINIAVEEIFVNIAHYAYAPGKGSATVRVEVSEAPVSVTITFIDKGIPYDPLKRADPDVTLSAEQRQIGGLGIFMTKKLMDDVAYEYKDGQNILTLKKNIN